MSKSATLDGALNFANKKSDKLYAAHMNTWLLKFFLKENKPKKLTCGLLVYCCMNYCMDTHLFRVKEWTKFWRKFKKKTLCSNKTLISMLKILYCNCCLLALIKDQI